MGCQRGLTAAHYGEGNRAEGVLLEPIREKRPPKSITLNTLLGLVISHIISHSGWATTECHKYARLQCLVSPSFTVRFFAHFLRVVNCFVHLLDRVLSSFIITHALLAR